MIKFLKPAYAVTIGSSFWNIITSKTNTEITYKPDVMEIPVIKTLGLARTVSETKIYASGITYDFMSQTSGAEITLGAVALPEELLNELEGTEISGGFAFNKTNDIGKEFAFGYWGENSDGSYMYYWHPVCKLVPADENSETRTDQNPEPNKEFKIVIIPYNGLWRVKYSTALAETENEDALSIEDFFARPIYRTDNLPTGEDE